MPLTQFGWGALDMVVRSTLSSESLVPGVRAAIQAIDPTIATGDFQTLNAIVDRASSSRRFILVLLAAFAGTALLLAALGIYGVLSYSVAQRIPEIGIRMALGESKAQVRRRVLGRTLALAGTGVALGAAGSLAMSRLISPQLYGVESTDALTFLSMATILMLVSCVAGYLPARRASRTDPQYALHHR